MVSGGIILADVNVVGVDGGGISTTRKLSRIRLNNLQTRQNLALDKAGGLEITCTPYVGFVSKKKKAEI